MGNRRSWRVDAVEQRDSAIKSRRDGYQGGRPLAGVRWRSHEAARYGRTRLPAEDQRTRRVRRCRWEDASRDRMASGHDGHIATEWWAGVPAQGDPHRERASAVVAQTRPTRGIPLLTRGDRAEIRRSPESHGQGSPAAGDAKT